jgi:hypothetical protein
VPPTGGADAEPQDRERQRGTTRTGGQHRGALRRRGGRALANQLRQLVEAGGAELQCGVADLDPGGAQRGRVGGGGGGAELGGGRGHGGDTGLQQVELGEQRGAQRAAGGDAEALAQPLAQGGGLCLQRLLRHRDLDREGTGVAGGAAQVRHQPGLDEDRGDPQQDGVHHVVGVELGVQDEVGAVADRRREVEQQPDRLSAAAHGGLAGAR